MGHEITFRVIEKEEDIYFQASEFASYTVDRQENPSGSYHGNLTIHKNGKIFSNYKEAEKAIEKLDNGWYDDHAVRFYDTSEAKETASIKRLKERLEKNLLDQKEYTEKHRIQNRKSQFIGCSNCESKLAKDRLRSQFCPLCMNDLRADYIVKRIEKYNEDSSILREQIELEKDKQKLKCPVRWLAKFEVHI